VSILTNATGPIAATITACATGVSSLIIGAMFLERGMADLALCGAVDFALVEPIVAGFATMNGAFRSAPGAPEETPARASRPFSVDRRGFVVSEGAGAVIIASGAGYRRLGVPGEQELTGKGVSFCATCDGALYRDQEIAMVGGGDTALTEILFLTRFAKKIHLIHRRDALRGAKYLQEQVLSNAKVEIHWNSLVEAFQGSQGLESLKLKNVKTGEVGNLPVTGCFIAIGITPNTHWLNNVVPMDEWGFVITDTEMATQVPGIFAAGDVRSKNLWQIATAVGDGAIAANSVEHYLDKVQRR